MNNLKRYLATAVAVTMMTTSFVPAFAAEDEESDTTSDYSYSEQAKSLYDVKLYKGIDEKTFNADLGSNLTRETGVVMLLRMFGKEDEALKLTDEDAKKTLSDKFKDSGDVSVWAQKQVAYAITNGYVKGYPDETFQPKTMLVGKAYCSLILQMLGETFTYDKAGEVFAKAAEVTDSDEAEAFGSGTAINKDTFVGISWAALKNAKIKGQDKTVAETLVESGDLDATKGTEVELIKTATPTVAPTAKVSVAPTTYAVPTASATATPSVPATVYGAAAYTVAGDNVPSKAVSLSANFVPVLKVNFTSASAVDTKVNYVVVTRTGISSDSDITGISLWDGVTQLGTTQGLVSGKVIFNLATPFTVPANTSKVLTVKANVSSGAGSGNEFALNLTEAKALDNATITGGPAVGNVMRFNSFTSATSTIATKATTYAPSTVLSLGKDDQSLAGLGVTVNSTSEDGILKGITLTRSGVSTDSDVSNLKLYDAITNTVVGTATGFTNGKATFTFATPIQVTKGSTKDFKLTGKINSTATSGGGLSITVNANTDIDMEGSTATMPCLDTVTSFPLTISTALTYNIGNLTLSNATSNTTAGSVVKGANAKMMVFTAKANSNEGVTITSVKVSDTLAASAVAADISAITIEDSTGTVVASTGSPTGAGTATATIQFVSGYTIPAGESKDLTVKAKFATSAVTSGTHTFSIVAVTDVVANGAASYKTLQTADKTLVGAVAGGTKTITANGSLTSAYDAASPVAGSTFVAGGKDITFGIFNIAAASEDINVTTFTIAEAVAGGAAVGDLTNVRLYQGTTMVGNAVSSGATTMTFTPSSAITIKADEVKSFTLKADTSTTSTGTYSLTYNGTLAAVGVSSGATITAPSALTARTLAPSAATLATANDGSLIAGNVIVGSNQALIGAFAVSAGTADDIEITELTVDGRTAGDLVNVDIFGSSSANYISNAAVYVNGVKVSDSKLTPSTGATNINRFVIGFSTPYVVAKGTTSVLQVKADVLAATGGAFNPRLQAISCRAKSSQATISGANLTGVVGLTTQSGLQTPTANGSLTVAEASNVITTSQELGDTSIVLSRFTAQANDEDLTMKSVTVNVAATVQTAILKNIKIMDGTNVVASYTPTVSQAAAGNGNVTISLPAPYYTILKGSANKKTFDIVGQFDSANTTSGSTVAVALIANGVSTTGVSSQATVASSNGAALAQTATKQFVKGKATVAVSSDSPTGTALLSSGATLNKFTITATGGAVTIPTGSVLNLAFSGDAAAIANFTDNVLDASLKLYDGSTLVGTQTAGAATLTMSSAVTIAAGETKTFYLKYSGTDAGATVVSTLDGTVDNELLEVDLTAIPLKDTATVPVTINDADNGQATTFRSLGKILKY